MTSALDDIKFLANSENRVRAIEALADGPRLRAELRDEIDVSSATISRLLAAFERRGWISRDGNRYELTALGAYVASVFTDLHDCMTSAHDLRELFPWLPLEQIGIEVESLTGARITVASEEDPLAITTRIREIELRSARSKSLSNWFPEPCVDARHQAVTGETQTFEAVITPAVVEASMSSNFATKFVELVSDDRCSVYVYDGDTPYIGGFNDGSVYLIVKDDRNVTVGLVETDHPMVVERFSETFEECRRGSTLLRAEALEDERGYVVART